MNFTIIKLKKKANREEAVTFCGFINATQRFAKSMSVSTLNTQQLIRHKSMSAINPQLQLELSGSPGIITLERSL